MKKYILLLALFFTQAYSEAPNHLFKDADIIFQDAQSSQSKAIKLATSSKYSHVGIIFKDNGKLYVYEAVEPVKITPLKRWIKNGKNEHFVLKRLKDETLLTFQNLKNMKKIGESFLGRHYDGLFGWGDDKIYCSELVWKVYERALGVKLGPLKKLKTFDLTHPIVKKKLYERYGNKIPFEEFAIAPQGIFDSKLLKIVYSN